VRTHIDDRDNYNPGWKFNNWEVKGIPIRIEIGKNEIAK
jgi:prolyl-tRNA synthetase